MKFFKRLLIIGIIILAIILLLFLITNSCFFFTTYRGAGDKTIFVPRFCYLYKEGGMTIATFYSFRSQKALQKEIDEYLSDFIMNVGESVLVCLKTVFPESIQIISYIILS